MDIEETHNAYGRATGIITAQRCPICHYPQEPSLIEIVSDHNELPQWIIDWHCGNTYLHTRIKYQQQKDNQHG